MAATIGAARMGAGSARNAWLAARKFRGRIERQFGLCSEIRIALPFHMLMVKTTVGLKYRRKCIPYVMAISVIELSDKSIRKMFGKSLDVDARVVEPMEGRVA